MAVYQFLRQNGLGLAMFTAGSCSVLASLYPHTVGLKEYEEQMTSRTEGKPDPVDEEVLLLAEKVKSDLKWHDSLAISDKLLKFIQTPNHEFSHQGSLATRWGAIIGIPALFSKKSIEEASEKPDLLLLKHNIDLNSDKGEKIFNTFKLSSDAKKFVLARELSYAANLQIYINSCCLGIAVVSCFIFSEMLSLPFRFRGSKFMSYLAVTPAMMLSYIKGSDHYNCYMDAKMDKTAASISESVAHGGVEYYSALNAQRQAFQKVNTQVSTIKRSRIAQAFDLEWRKTELDPLERKSRLLELTKKFVIQENIES